MRGVGWVCGGGEVWCWWEEEEEGGRGGWVERWGGVVVVGRRGVDACSVGSDHTEDLGGRDMDVDIAAGPLSAPPPPLPTGEELPSVRMLHLP